MEREPREFTPSCKFFGDNLHLRGGLLGEPQLFPLLVEFHHFEDAQCFTARRTPTHPFMLLTRSDDLIDPFFHPATANWFACRLAAALIDDLRPMLLQVPHQGRQWLRVFGLHVPS